MTYLALTQGTAEWLHGKTGLIDAIRTSLFKGGAAFRPLEESEFAEGPVRMAASKEREVIAIWNTDYLTGTGEEAWGFILLDSEGGLLGKQDISQEVLERCIYVISQRLQKLLIDGAYIHRSHPNGAHTLLAGRGNRARHYSIGYFEQVIDTRDAQKNAILCVGPDKDLTFTRLSQRAFKEGKNLSHLVQVANNLASPKTGRPAVSPKMFLDFREKLASFIKTRKESVHENEYASVQVATSSQNLNMMEPYRVQELSYTQWIAADGPLTDIQRRILKSEALDHHPLRIVGPGGSGKTLLMQLLAVKVLTEARNIGKPTRILYIVHNSPMRDKVEQRFAVLLGQPLSSWIDGQHIEVSTLSDYGRNQLGIDFANVINADAYESKLFQLEEVSQALSECMQDQEKLVKGSPLLTEVKKNPELQQVFAVLVMAEISAAIKGHGLELDKRRYVESQQSLSRLHGILAKEERGFIYDTFMLYQKNVIERYQVLDTDDIALSLLGRLRTPLWELKRKEIGYDYIFVDETQLFNENERRILPLLTKGITDHVPIALALDEAQQPYGQNTAGLATIGIKDITSESLPSIHRSTRAIVKLAFFVIQRCTELFSADFPDFTKSADEMALDSHPWANSPQFEIAKNGTKGLATAIEQRVRVLRKKIRQIAIICHSDQYWASILETLKESKLPLYVIEQRGEKLPVDEPLVVLARPAHVGGQEFDAVILVGLEQGVIPPRVTGNNALAAAIEQQVLREIYLAVTRARFQLIIMLSHRASPTQVLRDAAKSRLIKSEETSDRKEDRS